MLTVRISDQRDWCETVMLAFRVEVRINKEDQGYYYVDVVQLTTNGEEQHWPVGCGTVKVFNDSGNDIVWYDIEEMNKSKVESDIRARAKAKAKASTADVAG